MDMHALSQSLQSTLGGQIPHLLGALAIFVIGWLVAVFIRVGVTRLLRLAALNRRFYGMTGSEVDLEGAFALALFWVVLLLTIIAVFNSLDLAVVSGPFAALVTEIFQYAPRLLSALLLAVVAWLLASIIRAGTIKLFGKTTLDEKLAEHANMAPIGDSLAQALFWLIVLLFLPAILGALQMHGLLYPLRNMVSKVLDMLPNLFAALVIGGIGWIVATVLRNITTNLSRTAGIDQFGNRVGLAESMQLSRIIGLLVFIVILLPSLISALDALQIDAISGPATDMLAMILQAVPNIIAAGLILVLTWVIGGFASKLLSSLLAALGFDSLPARINMAHAFDKTSASTFIGRIAFFFAMLFATVEASGMLGFVQLSHIVSTFIRFGGDILLGSTVLVVGFWLANVACTAIEQASGSDSKGLARIARYAILALVIAMGLRAMGIADDIVNLAFGLTLGAIAVSVALSFGLGGREAAGKLMEHWLAKLRPAEKK